MADTTSNIVITATNKARANLLGVKDDFDHIGAAAKKAETQMGQVGRNTPGLTSLKGSISSVDSTIGKLTGGLGGLSSMFGVAGVAGAAMGLGKMAFDLAQLGDQATRGEARLAAFAGGAAGAAAATQAITVATDGALSKMEATAAATRFFSMGLANNAQQAANMARAALLLGDASQSASEKIDNWSLMLANQSVERLDSFGISSGKVREEIAKLQAATPGLTRETAFLNVVMAQATTKMALLEAQGVKTGTATDKLSAAWKNLNVELGKKIAPVVLPAIEFAASEAAGGTEANKAFAIEKLTAATSQLSDARRRLADATVTAREAEGGDPWRAMQAEGSKKAAEAAVEHATAEYRVAEANVAYVSGASAAVFSAEAQAEAAKKVASAMIWQAQATQIAIDTWAGGPPGWAAIQANVSTGGGTRMVMPTAPVSWGPTIVPTGTSGATSGKDIFGKFGMPDYVAGISDLGRYWKGLADDAESAAKKTQSEWQKTFDSLKSEANSYAGIARQASIALTPGGKAGETDWLKPGANGPFEKLFQAKDIAVHGEASPWAKALGMTQEDAKKITTEFESGIMSAGVKALVDKQAIVDRVRLQKLAEETEAAFADEIAAAAGADTRSVDEILGFTDAKVTTAGANVGAKMGKALDAQSGTLKTAGAGMADNTLSGLDTKTQDFYNLGFKQGQQYLAGQAAALDAHSPSRAMMRLGKAALEGFNIGASGGYGFGGVSSGTSGGSRGGGSPTMYSRSVRYYEGDYNTFIVNSDAALVTVMAAQRASKQKRLGTG